MAIILMGMVEMQSEKLKLAGLVQEIMKLQLPHVLRLEEMESDSLLIEMMKILMMEMDEAVPVQLRQVGTVIQIQSLQSVGN